MKLKNMPNTYKYIIATAICLIIGVAIAFALASTNGTVAAKNSIKLGDKYLEKTDYTSAISAYNAALAVEPNNKEALLGMANAYKQSGDVDFAKSIIEENSNEQITESFQTVLIEIELEKGNILNALNLLKPLVELTNDTTYKEKMDELLQQYFALPHSYAVGNQHEVRIANNTVQTKGQNILGQLGYAQGIENPEFIALDFNDAGFQLQPKQVYATQYATYVIDQSGKLWVAGSNRSAQLGLGSAQSNVSAGWAAYAGMDNVAKVAGKDSNLMILKTDGTLWHIGENTGELSGMLWNSTPVQITRFGLVRDIFCNDVQTALVTIDGTLYAAEDNQYDFYAAKWSLIAKGVTQVICDGDFLAWLNGKGQVFFESQIPTNLPSQWTNEAVNRYACYTPDKEVAAIAGNKNMFAVYAENQITVYGSGTPQVLSTEDKIKNLYGEGTNLVAEYQNGESAIWNLQNRSR